LEEILFREIFLEQSITISRCFDKLMGLLFFETTESRTLKEIRETSFAALFWRNRAKQTASIVTPLLPPCRSTKRKYTLTPLNSPASPHSLSLAIVFFQNKT
jgi:hypothetical protein